MIKVFSCGESVIYNTNMASDTEGEEATYTADAATSGDEHLARDLSGRKRQVSVPELMRRAEVRRAKRNAPGACFNSPPGNDAPGAKRRSADASVVEPGSLNSDTMDAIKQMVESATAVATSKVILAFNSKFEAMERRLEIVEAENMSQDNEIKQLKLKLEADAAKIQHLQDQVESIDVNRRLDSLILTCADFEHKEKTEDMEERAVEALNKRMLDLGLELKDLNTAHRLKADNRVIVKFARRSVRNRVYEGRFDLPREQRDSEGRKMAPLYIAECLTAKNNDIYQELLRARRPENGSVIASVSSRRGIVICKKQKGGTNIRVPDEEHLVRMLNGVRFPPTRMSRTSGDSRRGQTAPGPHQQQPQNTTSEATSGTIVPVNGPGPSGVRTRQPQQPVTAQPGPDTAQAAAAAEGPGRVVVQDLAGSRTQ